jgi:hypothetical protein
MPRAGAIRNLGTLVVGLSVVAGCTGASSPRPTATATGDRAAIETAEASQSPSPSPTSATTMPPGWTRIEAAGVAVAMPAGFATTAPQDADFADIVLQATRPDPGGQGWSGQLRLGWLLPANALRDAEASATGIVQNWWIPMLGDAAIDRTADRAVNAAGSDAHEVLVMLAPSADGIAFALDIIVVERGGHQAYVEYIVAGHAADFPSEGFLPDTEPIVASLAFAAGAEPTPIPTTCPTLATGTKRSGRLAFVGENAVCVADLESGDVRAIVLADTDPYRGPDGFPPFKQLDWSPDGRQLAFVRSLYPATTEPQPLTDELIIVNADGSGPRVLPAPPDARGYLGLSWSPDGRSIAAAANRSGCSGCASIWVLDVATGTWSALRMTDEATQNIESPRWAPDGRRLVAIVDHVVSGYDTVARVEVFSGSDALADALPVEARFIWSVDWSDDGRSIAISSTPTVAPSEVTIVSPDGSGSRPLAGTDGSSEVRWAFDDTAVLRERSMGTDPTSIWIVPLDGSQATLLVVGRDPAWVAD